MKRTTLQEFLKRPNLYTEIIVNSENIEPKEVKELSQALKANKSVTALSLGENNIGPEETKELAEVLKNHNYF